MIIATPKGCKSPSSKIAGAHGHEVNFLKCGPHFLFKLYRAKMLTLPKVRADG